MAGWRDGVLTVLLVCMLRLWLQSKSEYAVCARARGLDLYRRTDPLFYGRGAYFSDTAAYCDESYAFEEAGQSVSPPHRELILARVLCGRVKEYGETKAPELISPPEGFDSVRGGPHKFNARGVASCCMTVVYDRAQVYPQYVVRYCTPSSRSGVVGAAASAGSPSVPP